MTPNEFTITVDGVGAFTFRKRNMRTEFAIQSEYSRLTEGVDTPTTQLHLFASMVSELKVLTVKAPEGWDIDQLDPLDDDSYRKIADTHRAMREKEQSFRRQASTVGAGDGAGNIADGGVRVSPAVPAGAD